MSRPSFSRDRPEQRRPDDGPRVNRDIVAKQIRLIDEAGEMRGVMTPREALALAEEAGLDLVEVSPNAEPPVCKIIDYGKYKYEAQKKAAEARKKQKIIEIKEIKLRPTIDGHDFEIKMRNARTFLEEGDKVKVTLRFRGREMAHQEVAYALLDKVKQVLEPFGKIEQMPKFEGRQIIMIIAAK